MAVGEGLLVNHAACAWAESTVVVRRGIARRKGRAGGGAATVVRIRLPVYCHQPRNV